MFLHVDGHSIPLFTDADVPEDDESREEYDKVVTVPSTDGAISAVLPGSADQAMMYTVRVENATRVLSDYTFVRPPGTDDVDLASLRPFRVQGNSDRRIDKLHQVRLFHAVGSVAVAGGHVEMAMKRVLVTLRGGRNKDLAGPEVPAEWSSLQAKLEKASKPRRTDLQVAVAELFSGEEAARLRDGRNDVVHGYWWLIPVGANGLVSSRYYRPNSKQAPAHIHPTLDLLQQLASELFDFANRLEAFVTPHWPLAIVPGIARVDSGRDIVLVSRPDELRTNPNDLRPPEPAKPKPGHRPEGSIARRKSRKRTKRN
jgi:hypothetical protein